MSSSNFNDFRAYTHDSDIIGSYSKGNPSQSNLAFKSIDGIAIGFAGPDDLVDHIGIYSPKRIMRYKYRPSSEQHSKLHAGSQ